MTGMITRRLRDLNRGTGSLKGPLWFKSVLKSRNFSVGPSSKQARVYFARCSLAQRDSKNSREFGFIPPKFDYPEGKKAAKRRHIYMKHDESV